MNSVNYDIIEIVGLSKEYPTNSTTFKQFQVQETLEIPSTKPDIGQVIRVTASGEILSVRTIEISRTISNEGVKLTGHKAIVEGRLLLKIEYTASTEKQSIHSVEFLKPFSSSIMLEEDMDIIEPLSVNIYIEDVYVKQMDTRKIFKSVLILLNAFPLNYKVLSENKYDNEYKGFSENAARERSFFSQFVAVETVSVPAVKPPVGQIITSIIDPEIVSLKLINSMKGISAEGQLLTGKMAVAEIKFREKTLYAGDMPEQSIHGIENEFYRTSYVVVPSHIEGTAMEQLIKTRLLKPRITIEDISVKRLNERNIFKSTIVFIELQLVPTFKICYSSCDENNETSLFMMYPDGRRNIPITGSDSRRYINPQWSPSGNSIAYMREDDEGDMLYLLNIKTLKSSRITPPDRFDTVIDFCWMPNGKKIVFTAGFRGSKDIFTFDTSNHFFGSLTYGTDVWRNFNPQPSPDGDKIAYIKSGSGEKNIWMMDASGENNLKLTEKGHVKDLLWSMNGSSIVYVAARERDSDVIYAIDIYSGEIKLLVDKPFIHKIRRIKISPDGKLVAFKALGNAGEDLFICDLESEELKNLTERESYTRISDFSWKTDSTEIYFAANTLGYYNIYSADLQSGNIDQLTHTHSTFIELSYRQASI